MVETPDYHPNSAVKHHWACLVLRWGTTRETYVLNDIYYCYTPLGEMRIYVNICHMRERRIYI